MRGIGVLLAVALGSLALLGLTACGGGSSPGRAAGSRPLLLDEVWPSFRGITFASTPAEIVRKMGAARTLERRHARVRTAGHVCHGSSQRDAGARSNASVLERGALRLSRGRLPAVARAGVGDHRLGTPRRDPAGTGHRGSALEGGSSLPKGLVRANALQRKRELRLLQRPVAARRYLWLGGDPINVMPSRIGRSRPNSALGMADRSVGGAHRGCYNRT